MPKNKTGLFACVNSKEPKLAISVPINYSAKKELDRLALDSKLSEEDWKILEEIGNESIEDQSNQTCEEKYSFSLKLSIKNFLQEKNWDAIDSLKAMLTVYKKLNSSNEAPKLTTTQDQVQSVVNIPLSGEQLASVQLKLKKANQQAYLQTATQENHQQLLVVNKEDLNRNRLRSANVNPVILNNKEAPSELDQLFAKRKEISKRKNNDTQTQNSQDNSSLLQKLQIAIKNLKKMEATEQTNNLSIWAEIDFLLERLAYSTNEKEEEDLEFRLDEKISHQFCDQSAEEFVKQAVNKKFEKLNKEISAKNSEKQLDKKTFQKLDLQAEFFNGHLSIIMEKNINIDGITSSDQSHSDASNGTDSKGFDEIQMQLQKLMEELKAIGPKQHEDLMSKDSNDKNVKFSENKIPTTVYFNNKTFPINNTDPMIISATLKP